MGLPDQFHGGFHSLREVLAATEDFLIGLTHHWGGSRVLLIAHSADRWALECLLNGAELGDLDTAPARWQHGWEYTVPHADPPPALLDKQCRAEQ